MMYHDLLFASFVCSFGRSFVSNLFPMVATRLAMDNDHTPNLTLSVVVLLVWLFHHTLCDSPLLPPFGHDHTANKETANLRIQIANACLDDMVQWFAEGGQVGILDGSNTTEERRQELVNRFKAYNITPLFIETICDNSAIIDANIRSVKVSSPDVSFFLYALSFSLSLLTLSQHAICSYDPFWCLLFFVLFMPCMCVCLVN